MKHKYYQFVTTGWYYGFDANADASGAILAGCNLLLNTVIPHCDSQDAAEAEKREKEQCQREHEQLAEAQVAVMFFKNIFRASFDTNL